MDRDSCILTGFKGATFKEREGRRDGRGRRGNEGGGKEREGLG